MIEISTKCYVTVSLILSGILAVLLIISACLITKIEKDENER